jgi:hypothetical protein
VDDEADPLEAPLVEEALEEPVVLLHRVAEVARLAGPPEAGQVRCDAACAREEARPFVGAGGDTVEVKGGCRSGRGLGASPEHRQPVDLAVVVGDLGHEAKIQAVRWVA